MTPVRRKLVSIERKVLAGFLASAVVLLLLGALVYRGVTAALDTAERVARAHEVITALESFQLAVFQAGYAQRGFYLDGGESQIVDRVRATNAAHGELEKLRRLTGADAAQRARLDALAFDLEDRIEAFESFERFYRQSGLDAVQRVMPVAMGSQLTQRMHVVAVELKQEEERALTRHRAEQATVILRGKLLAGAVLLILLAFQGWLFRKIRDETAARHASEADLLGSEARLREILEVLPIGVSLRTAPGQPRQDNRAGQAILHGWDGDATGSITRAWWVRDGRPLTDEDEPLARALRGAASPAEEEIELEFAEGTRKVLLVAWTPLRATGGAVAVFQDITSLKRAEQSLREAARLDAMHRDALTQLAGELRLTNDDIARKNALLEDASRMKSEFLANMSHELRTPLNAIIGFSEVLRDGLLGEMEPKQREYISDIFESGQHLLALINDILDLSKIEAGKLELDFEALPLEALFVSSVSMLRERAVDRRIGLDLDVDRSIGIVRGDARKTRQILYNLLSNAIKFSREGARVALSAKRVSRDRAASAMPGDGPGFRLTLPEGDATAFLEISARDSGIGLAPDDMERLFQPFVQIESSLSRQYEGTGLGLAMVRRLAELHGGTVAVASTPGQGSCFTVWLPYRPAGDAVAPFDPESAATTAVEGQPGSALALIIEDDGNAAEHMRGMLVREGYRVATARSAEQGLELAKRVPAIIVLDILLPDMDGWECLVRLKQTPSVAHVPVVIVSMVADRDKGRALGAAAVLQKPFQREELLAAVARLALSDTAAGMRVLLIDDDPKSVELAALILTDAGCNVLRADGGADGIAQALRAPPDLIVLDLMMPGVNGFDVVATLRTEPRTAQIPILVLTCKELTDSDHLKLDGRVQSIVTKAAFGPEAFMNEVRRALAVAYASRAGVTA